LTPLCPSKAGNQKKKKKTNGTRLKGGRNMHEIRKMHRNLHGKFRSVKTEEEKTKDGKVTSSVKYANKLEGFIKGAPSLKQFAREQADPDTLAGAIAIDWLKKKGIYAKDQSKT